MEINLSDFLFLEMLTKEYIKKTEPEKSGSVNNYLS